MHPWLVVTALAYLASLMWIAWNVFCAPVAAEDANGFHVIEPAPRVLTPRTDRPPLVWFG